ncbi:MAG: hypothetical protein HY394_03200 [Candidatus Diapherotrites archaeon]|nr:hypothetical protein [Candidatus Diapherotrites archaeon]
MSQQPGRVPLRQISEIHLLVHPEYHVGTAWNLTNEPTTLENSHQDWLGVLAREDRRALRRVKRGWSAINALWGRRIMRIRENHAAMLVILPFEYIPGSDAQKRSSRLLEFAKAQLGDRLVVLPAGIQLNPRHVKEALQKNGFGFDSKDLRIMAFGETEEVCVPRNLEHLVHGLGLPIEHARIESGLSTSENVAGAGGYYHRQAGKGRQQRNRRDSSARNRQEPR